MYRAFIKQKKGEKNKRPMGHIAHQRKVLKSINTYDYIIRLLREEKNINNFTNEEECFVPSLVEIGSVVLEKKTKM